MRIDKRGKDTLSSFVIPPEYEKNMETRRAFLKKSAAAGSGLVMAPTIIPARAFGANDRVHAAVLGLNGRGHTHVSSLMAQQNVEVSIHKRSG